MNFGEAFFVSGTIFFIFGTIISFFSLCFIFWIWYHFRKIKQKTNSFFEEIQKRIEKFFDLFSNVTTIISKIFDILSQRKKEKGNKKVKE